MNERTRTARAPAAVASPDVAAEAGPSVAANAAPIAVPPASFEAAMTELESLVEQMEDGRLPLEASLAAYQRGVTLVRFCRDTLGDVAQRVRILEADLLQPFAGGDDDPDA